MAAGIRELDADIVEPEMESLEPLPEDPVNPVVPVVPVVCSFEHNRSPPPEGLAISESQQEQG